MEDYDEGRKRSGEGEVNIKEVGLGLELGLEVYGIGCCSKLMMSLRGE